MTLAWAGVVAAMTLPVYTYVLYPTALWLLARFVRRLPVPKLDPDAVEWPAVSISVPAYNEEHQIAETVESLLALDYPRDRLQILIVSDASSDRTDEIVQDYAPEGVQLVRQPARSGKTAAENFAATFLTGEIVINTDASIRIRPHALKAIVAPFQDPSIGLASGRDISVGPEGDETNEGEGGYVGYEMSVRDLETRVSGIVGASGCFYAIRRELHLTPLPGSMSRDFASALITTEAGFRAVSVSEATCLVPRMQSLRREYRRKVRTMARGMRTLAHKRALLNARVYGLYSWMLASHKIGRWLVPWAAALGFLCLLILAPGSRVALAGLIMAVALLVPATLGWLLADRERLPRTLSLLAFGLMGNVAAIHATVRAVRAGDTSKWEPTRRGRGDE